MTVCRTFTVADQEAFARWSGDRNPIHMDPLAARRSVAGAPVVHGMHLLLWVMEEALSAGEHDVPIRIRADFRKFVLVGQQVSLERSTARDGHARYRLATNDGLVATVHVGPAGGAVQNWASADFPIVEGELRTPTLSEMHRSCGRLSLLETGAGEAFPYIANRLSGPGLAALARISALVGMTCPGLHSILAAVELDLRPNVTEHTPLSFRTSKLDERFRLVRMEVSGPGIGGLVEAFIRPALVEPLTMAQASEMVAPGQFVGRRALVVGGSRGLGAVTAKLLAAGGGDVLISYATGSAEAAAICGEIAMSRCGSCSAIALDVRKHVTEQLRELPWRPTHIHYFATPRIFLQKSAAFDREVFDKFAAFYVKGFNALCSHFAEVGTEAISILYPSSIAVTDRPLGLTEYAMAKAAGELLCLDLMRMHPHLHIAIERLPRILTDQTATVRHTPAARPEDVMLPLLTR